MHVVEGKMPKVQQSSYTIAAREAACTFIKRARAHANISQEELARRLNRSKGYISQIESPKRAKSVPLTLLFEVAAVANYSGSIRITGEA